MQLVVGEKEDNVFVLYRWTSESPAICLPATQRRRLVRHPDLLPIGPSDRWRKRFRNKELIRRQFRLRRHLSIWSPSTTGSGGSSTSSAFLRFGGFFFPGLIWVFLVINISDNLMDCRISTFCTPQRRRIFLFLSPAVTDAAPVAPFV